MKNSQINEAIEYCERHILNYNNDFKVSAIQVFKIMISVLRILKKPKQQKNGGRKMTRL